MTNSDPRVIVALDYPDRQQAMQFVDRISPQSCKLKVGLELFVKEGPDFVRELTKSGFDVFLDLKFHDIPNTVAAACRSAASLDVWMINVHCMGGKRMMRAASESLREVVPRNKTLLLGVTILTSHEQSEIQEIGLNGDIASIAQSLTSHALEAGLDGVVCSPWEAASLRQKFGDKIKLVTPGIRPSGSASGDQSRIMTPAQAIQAGSSYLVVGRPVTQSADPVATLRQINQEIGGIRANSPENT